MTKSDDERELGHAQTDLGVGDYNAPEDDARTANLKPRKAQLDAPEIPGYKITGVLGEGGMGTVYAALQDSPHRKVAIKIMHRGSHSAWLRFQTEAEVMARLDHPGIASVFEAGEADGQPFLVMDFIEGTTLDEFVPSVPLRTRLELFVAICDAVHHAHVKGVIHRDLKPANVMVGEGRRAVVLDFGVARLADDSTPGPTRAGELIGTPLYMSPEQARLRPDEVDARTDVYTLGVMLYELACDELPYEAPRGLPLPVLTVLICDEPAVPLGKRVPALRGDLEAIAAKALAKDARDRYQSVAALADDVRRYLDELPVSVRMPGPLERTRRFVRRRPLTAASIAAALLAVIVFSGVVTALWLEARTARRTAELAHARTEIARQELEARTTELTLKQARSALARDPTEALAWLATLPAQAQVDARVAWMIADEARARGVAKDILRGHTDEVHWIEPLGTGFVSAGYDGRVIVWDPAPHVVFTADTGRVHIARPSPDGSRIAIGGDGGVLAVIDRDGGHRTLLGTFQGDVQKVEWSPDGAWLAAASDQGNVWLFPHGTGPGRERAVFTSKDAREAINSALPSGALRAPAQPGLAIEALAFSTDGARLFAGNDAGVLRSWGVNDDTHDERALGAALLAVWSDGARLMAVDADGTVFGEHGQKLETKIKTKRVAFARDGSWLALGGVGGEVVRVQGTTVSPLHVHRAQVRSLAISPDARWIASGGDDGSLIVEDNTTHRVLALHGHTGRIRDVAFTGTTLCSSDSDGVVRRWDLAQLGTNVLATTGPPVQKLATSDTYLAAVDDAGQVTRWTLADGTRATLDRIDGRVSELAMFGDLVVSARANGLLGWHGIHPTFKGAPLAGPDHVSGAPRAVALVGDWILVGTSSGSIEPFTVAGLGVTRLDALVQAHAGGTDAIASEPGTLRFASGGQDRAIRIWQRTPGRPAPGAAFAADTIEPLAELPGPHGDTHFLAYTPDGTRLIAAGNDGSVFAWEVHQGVVDAASRKVIAQHTGAVTALAVTNDQVISAGRDLALIRVARDGSTERATIATAATMLAFGLSGTVFAVTRGGAALRWERGALPVVEIDHGVVAATRIDAGRWALAFDDGAIVVVGLGAVSLGDLHARIAALTTYRLHSDVGTAPATPPASAR